MATNIKETRFEKVRIYLKPLGKPSAGWQEVVGEVVGFDEKTMSDIQKKENHGNEH